MMLNVKWWICSLQTRHFLIHKMLIAGLKTCGLLVNYCKVSIGCLDSHSDGTHSLQRIHWWTNYVMLHLFKSWIPWGWVLFSKYSNCNTYIDDISIILLYHAALFWMIFKTLPLLLSPLVWTGLKALHCCSSPRIAAAVLLMYVLRTKGTGWGSPNRS